MTKKTICTCPACPAKSANFSSATETIAGTAVVLGVRSSHSRYVDLYICSDCGIGEALTGFFWEDVYLRKNPTQPKGFNPYEQGPAVPALGGGERGFRGGRKQP
jgi:hypothetical protein